MTYRVIAAAEKEHTRTLRHMLGIVTHKVPEQQIDLVSTVEKTRRKNERHPLGSTPGKRRHQN